MYGVRDWKLIVGTETYASWYGMFSPNNTASGMNKSAPQPSEACQPACLFNIAEDPGEHKDMATIERGLVAKMLARFKELEQEYHPRVVPPPKLGAAFCAAANAHSGFTAPYCAYAPAGSDGCP